MLSREQILKTIHDGPEAIVDLIEALMQRIEHLESIINKNSQNSSKPPSSDGFKKAKRTQSQRKKSGKKPGGQKGSKGYFLQQTQNVDEVLEYPIETCLSCNENLKLVNSTNIVSRQVFELPEFMMKVTEHQAEVKLCPCCHIENTAKFPIEVTRPVQYGSGVKAFAVYLMNQHFIPYKRTSQIFTDLFNSPMSEGSLLNFNKECYSDLEKTELHIKDKIINSSVAHFDESGMRISGKNFWIHSASTLDYTFYAHHQKRGSEAMNEIGILPLFKGVAVHDHWSSYSAYKCFHALCNAHHLRELTYIGEQKKEDWAKKMGKCLCDIWNSVKHYRSFRKSLPLTLLTFYLKKYRRILTSGFTYHEEIKKPAPIIGILKRGRKKQAPGKNFLDRLKGYEDWVLLFMYDFTVPFDNNLAESDIRMTKLKQKISGCYRSREGAKYFCRIRGVISTLRKQDRNILGSLKLAFSGADLV
jgi:transposase